MGKGLGKGIYVIIPFVFVLLIAVIGGVVLVAPLVTIYLLFNRWMNFIEIKRRYKLKQKRIKIKEAENDPTTLLKRFRGD